MLKCMQHATGGSGRDGYRNFYSAGEFHNEIEALRLAVDKGLMIKRDDPFDKTSESFVYHVTEDGFKYLEAN